MISGDYEPSRQDPIVAEYTRANLALETAYKAFKASPNSPGAQTWMSRAMAKFANARAAMDERQQTSASARP